MFPLNPYKIIENDARRHLEHRYPDIRKFKISNLVNLHEKIR